MNYIKFNDALTSTYIGFQTGAAITTATKGTFLGYQAGKAVTTGNGNTFVGQQAGLLHDTGANNVYIGDQVAADPSVGARTAQRNTFVGQSSGYSIKTGQNNVFIGKNTGGGSTGVGPAQSSNVFVGSQSGQVNTADNNTFLGFNTGAANSTGTQNVFIGSGVGTSVTTGSGNIFIGYNIAGTAASSNQLNIAAYIFGDLSLGKVGFGVSSPGAAVEIKANTTTIASVKLNDGTLLTTPVAGSLEPVTDRLAYTTATGTTRKYVNLLVYRGISAARTLDGSDELVNVTSGTFAVTLPTAVGFTNPYIIKNSGTGVTTLNTTGGQTIDGSASGVITLNQYDWVVLRSNGSNWIIVG